MSRKARQKSKSRSIGSAVAAEAAVPERPRRKTGIQSIKAHLYGVALTAFLLAFVFPPMGFWWLAHVALVPLIILTLRSGRTGRLIWTTFVVLWIWWMWMIRWMWPVTGGGMIALAAFMAAEQVLALYAIRRLDRRLNLPMVIVVPLAWITVDWLRGFWPQGGFGWMALAHSQAPFAASSHAPLLIQIADLGGEWTVGLLVAMSNGLVVDLMVRPWFRALPEGRRQIGRAFVFSVGLYAAALIGTLIYGAVRVAQTSSATAGAGSVAVTVVQTNIPQDNKESPTRETDRATWGQMESYSRRAAAGQPKPQLIVWPETMVPAPINPEAAEFYNRQAEFWEKATPSELADGERGARVRQLAQSLGLKVEDLPAYMASWTREQAGYRRRISALAGELGIAHLIGSSSVYPAQPGPERRYNSVYLFDAQGRPARERYDKIHRVPFGEYIPWVEDVPWLKDAFFKYLSPYGAGVDYTVNAGADVTVFHLPLSTLATQADSLPPPPSPLAISFGAPICFEDTDAGLCRSMIYDSRGNKHADLLVNLTNDGWFPGSIGVYAGTDEHAQHLQNSALRCVENRVPLARSVNTGISGFIDSTGRIGPLVERLHQNERIDGVASSVVKLDRRRTLFGWWGQIPISILACATGTLFLLSLVPRKRLAPADR